MSPICACAVIVQLASKNSPETFLGNAGVDSLWVQQIFTQGTGQWYGLTLRFLRRHAGTVVASKDFKGWYSTGVPDVYCVGYYVGNGRRQVFVSMIAQRITNDLLDFDGKKVRVLYEPGQGRWYGGAEGHVQAWPTWDAKGNFAIREKFYPKEKIVNGKTVFLEHSYTVTRTVHIKGQ